MTPTPAEPLLFNRLHEEGRTTYYLRAPPGVSRNTRDR